MGEIGRAVYDEFADAELRRRGEGVTTICGIYGFSSFWLQQLEELEDVYKSRNAMLLLLMIAGYDERRRAGAR